MTEPQMDPQNITDILDALYSDEDMKGGEYQVFQNTWSTFFTTGGRISSLHLHDEVLKDERLQDQSTWRWWANGVHEDPHGTLFAKGFVTNGEAWYSADLLGYWVAPITEAQWSQMKETR